VRVFEDVGRGTIGFLDYAGGVATLAGEAGSVIARLRIRVGETFAQAYFLGVQSTAIVLLTSLFTGMVISLESANQAKSYGVSSLVGGAVAYVSSRELGPMLTAVVVAGRAGAAIAAELGSMVVTEQIEALEALGLSPVQMLVVPRLIALVLMYLAHNTANISYGEFIQSVRQFSAFEDYVKGMVKAVFFGILIAVICCYQGLRVRGGAAGVGQATTGAVVTSIILVFAMNFVLSLILFGSGTR
jgi:phospholipid/cholesterol/gamma-HCH transport system permease protein